MTGDSLPAPSTAADRTLRLLSVIHGPAFGGAHNQALRLRPLLEERGIRTLVVLPDEAERAAERLRESGVQTLAIPLGRLRATPDPRTQIRFAIRLRADLTRLRGVIHERRIDVVQVHGATNPQGAIAAAREGAAVVWQLFDTRAPMALRRTAMPLVTRHTDAMTVWGRELARVHPGAAKLGSRLIVVYPPVDGQEFAPDESLRRAARADLGVSESEKLIGSVGVLNPQKGHEHLVRAAELVLARRPETRFRVLGASSPAHDSYESGLREEVTRRGLGERFRFVDPGGEVCQLIHAFDLFALSSVPRSEGMPTVILEAMHAGKPVVATDVGAVSELIEDGRSGLVVPPQDPEAMAVAILRLLDDPVLAARLTEAASARARARFGLDRLADLHERAYRLAVEYRASRGS